MQLQPAYIIEKHFEEMKGYHFNLLEHRIKMTGEEKILSLIEDDHAATPISLTFFYTYPNGVGYIEHTQDTGCIRDNVEAFFASLPLELGILYEEATVRGIEESENIKLTYNKTKIGLQCVIPAFKVTNKNPVEGYTVGLYSWKTEMLNFDETPPEKFRYSWPERVRNPKKVLSTV